MRWRSMVRRPAKAAAALVGVMLLALAAAAAGLELFKGSTPAIAATSGTQSIASLEKWTIGGVDQWILIRGADRTKPIVLFLHGGPGMPTMYLAHAFQRSLERDFVVVQWDRRGAGKSYAARDASPAPTLRQTLADTFELTEHLRRRFGQDRIYLVGHSWGSYLGLLAAHERPDLYAAYIGTGQMAARSHDVEAERVRYFRRAASARGDQAMLAKLSRGEPIGEDDLFSYGVELVGARSFWPLLWLGLKAPEYRLTDVVNVPRGAGRLIAEMRDDVGKDPPNEHLKRFKTPIFFLLGRHDLNTPSGLAARYLADLKAPDKGVVWFERSAHFPFLEESERFRVALATIDRRVRATMPTTDPEPAREKS